MNGRRIAATAGFAVLMLVGAVIGVSSALNAGGSGDAAVVEKSEQPAEVASDRSAEAQVDGTAKPSTKKAVTIDEGNLEGREWLASEIGEENVSKWAHALALAIGESGVEYPAQAKVKVVERKDADGTYAEFENTYWLVAEDGGSWYAERVNGIIAGVNVSEADYDSMLRSQGWDVNGEEER